MFCPTLGNAMSDVDANGETNCIFKRVTEAVFSSVKTKLFQRSCIYNQGGGKLCVNLMQACNEAITNPIWIKHIYDGGNV